jgi:guanylate kinase
MGKIICLIGKSGSGKDTVFGRLLSLDIPQLEPVVTYTTRPRRANEQEGREYYFTDDETLGRLEREGKVIEKRTYHTVHGDWNYFICETDMGSGPRILIGTPDVVEKLCERYGNDSVCVIYLELPDRERLQRCINRKHSRRSPITARCAADILPTRRTLRRRG